MIRLGDRLREERMGRGLSFEDVAKATKIRASFLEALENGEYQKLPSGSYMQGFVKNYASFLGLSPREASALFRREFNEKEYFKVLPEGLSKNDDIPLGGFRVGQRVMFIGLLFFILFGYLFFQYRFAFINPPLDVSSPKENSEVAQTIVVVGKTDPNATLFINEYPVTIESDGTFSKSISSFPGKSVIKIRSQNRFGKTTLIERHIQVQAD